MKSRGQLALAIAAGYMLGRRKKTRLALMLGAAALTGKLGGGVAGQLTKLLGSGDGLGKAVGDVLGKATGGAAGEAVPGLGEVGDMIRQDLTSVAKRAAATAISNQIESLSDQLRDRADAIREQAAGPAKETGEEEAEDTGDGERTVRQRVPGRRQRDEQAEEEDEELAEEEGEEPAEEEPRAGARSGRPARAPSRPARATSRPARATSPIRRTQR
jgi:hypothetical protein